MVVLSAKRVKRLGCLVGSRKLAKAFEVGATQSELTARTLMC